MATFKIQGSIFERKNSPTATKANRPKRMMRARRGMVVTSLVECGIE
jgi:hypothetical protein